MDDQAVVAAIEELGRKVVELTNQMQAWAATAALHDYQPWVGRMSQEYHMYQDLDGDGLAFGHDFAVAEFDLYPAMLFSLVKPLRAKVEAQTLGIDEGPKLNLISAADYYEKLTDPRDKKSVARIFRLPVEDI